MIRKYPAGNQERDSRVSARRDSRPSFGLFGAVVYIYKLSLENRVAKSNQDVQGKLYHPVDTPEEASYWLNYYKSRTVSKPWQEKPEYEDAYFVPTGFF